MPLRSAVAVVDFQQIIVSDKVADRHRLETERLRLATAPGLFPIPLDLNELGRRAINFEFALLRHSSARPASSTSTFAGISRPRCAIKLAIEDMRQDNAVGVDARRWGI